MKIKIKTWNRMEKEFGLSATGNINCNRVFTKEMEKKLPSNRIVNARKRDRVYFWKNWVVSNDMIEEIIEIKAQYFIHTNSKKEKFCWYYPDDGSKPRFYGYYGWCDANDPVDSPDHKKVSQQRFLEVARKTKGWSSELKRNPWLEERIELPCADEEAPVTNHKSKWIVKHEGLKTIIRKNGIKGIATWDGTGRESRLMGLLVASLKALGVSHDEINKILKDSEKAYRNRHKDNSIYVMLNKENNAGKDPCGWVYMCPSKKKGDGTFTSNSDTCEICPLNEYSKMYIEGNSAFTPLDFNKMKEIFKKGKCKILINESKFQV